MCVAPHVRITTNNVSSESNGNSEDNGKHPEGEKHEH